MSIEAIFLYGSYARGDQGERSDNDLLMVTDENRGYHVTDGYHSMTYYPLSTLKDKATLGDLFVYHIVLEAKSVFDPNDVLGLLRGLFRRKSSYNTEIAHGADMGWFLVHNHTAFPERLGAKRIAWSVRTILIAKSAMKDRPVFAPDKLPGFSHFHGTELLVRARHGTFTHETIQTLQSFLEFEGLSDPLGAEASEGAWSRHFAATKNQVGIQLMKTLDQGATAPPYG